MFARRRAKSLCLLMMVESRFPFSASRQVVIVVAMCPEVSHRMTEFNASPTNIRGGRTPIQRRSGLDSFTLSVSSGGCMKCNHINMVDDHDKCNLQRNRALQPHALRFSGSRRGPRPRFLGNTGALTRSRRDALLRVQASVVQGRPSQSSLGVLRFMRPRTPSSALPEHVHLLGSRCASEYTPYLLLLCIGKRENQAKKT